VQYWIILARSAWKLARNLLAIVKLCWGVVRDVNKAKVSGARACEMVADDYNDAAALTDAYEGVVWCMYSFW